MSSVELTVPDDRQLVAVEVPGRVDNVGNAVQALGGMDAIAEAFSGAGPGLTLALRPDDPYEIRLDGAVHDSTTLLLAVRRNAPPVVVGRVRRQIRFDGLADFQVVDDGSQDLAPPIAFSHVVAPREYRFLDQSTATQEKRIKSRLEDHFKRFSRFALLPFESAAVPSAPEAGSFSASDKALSHPVTTLLKQEFESRPVISKRRLLYTMQQLNQDRRSVLRYVHSVAYRFSGGPWRGLWCRYGYDPRRDPSSLPYQCIDVRIRDDLLLMEAANRTEPIADDDEEAVPAPAPGTKRRKRVFNGLNPSHPDVKLVVLPTDIDFSAPPRRVFSLYQLCDLSGPELQSVVLRMRPTAMCTKRHGWANPADIADLRAAMRSRIDAWTRLAAQRAQSSSASWQKLLHDAAGAAAAAHADDDFPADHDGLELDDSEEATSPDEFEVYD
ncbi:Transcription factor IIIC subunit 5 HTH domain-containing protein [Plasmodiophora brassicae]|uniref:Transcription factor IIIC subunit 5 HTH domain-containing protein n=1 Tax=Plasmodiophora brassicae TaxID=37360 RepID=A0A0G4J804_PLABS|nr:hypothetical protein PBRA_003345 [Plasmodiophora brassicae]SPQ99698.1 unnamed protein product [Plasmodiophora brassicae]